MASVSLDFLTTPNTTRTILTSVGGFSKPDRRHIQSLQDLVVTLQRLNLQSFDSADLQNARFVGEGGSYKVSRCEHQVNGQVYAVKEIKLPPVTAGSGSFERQIGCVLRDIETMACLSDYENILNVIGYSWNIQGGSVIPFVITEFAAEGTLRGYLKSKRIPLHEKLMLCRDVAQGLHALHTCGVAHGDLKLENVLARSPWDKSKFAGPELNNSSSIRVTACISDFGHSLHLFDDEEDDDSRRRYGGTVAYNAPEISSDEAREDGRIDYRKCDVWSLGLLCWEILTNGQAYYQRPKVASITKESSETWNSVQRDSAVDSKTTHQHSTTSLLTRLGDVKPRLADIVCDDLSEELGTQLSQMMLHNLLPLFRRCLAAKPGNRAADVPSLPFLRRATLKKRNGPGPRLQISRRNNRSYEIFWQSHVLPYTAKSQLVTECEKVSNESIDSMTSARASLQTAFAYVNEFGCCSDFPEAIRQLERSISKGLEAGQILLPAFSNLVAPTSSTQSTFEAPHTSSTGPYSPKEELFLGRSGNEPHTPTVGPLCISRRDNATSPRPRAGSAGSSTKGFSRPSPVAHVDSNQDPAPSSSWSVDAVDDPDGDSNSSSFVEVSTRKSPAYWTPSEEPQTPVKEPLFQSVFSNPHTRRIIINSFRNSATNHRSEVQWYERTLLQLHAPNTDLKETINSQDGNGNTVLLLACRRGQLETVRWLLSKGVNPGIPNTDGCIPLHWLFMFNPEALQDLIKPLAEGVDVNAVAYRDQAIDPQIPLRLCGTPLAYAIETESNEAISALQSLRATPFRGLDLESRKRNTKTVIGSYNSSALHVACRTHMAALLGYMLDENFQRVKPNPKEHLSLARFCFLAFPSASRAELVLRHGGATRQAAEEAAKVLVKFAQKYAKDLDLSGMLQPAIIYGNLEASYAILNAVKLLTPYQGYRKAELDKLFWGCTDAACSGCFSKETSLKILGFGLDMGGDIDCVGLRGLHPINIPIAHHDAEVLGWFLSNNATVYVRDNQGASPLQQLIRNGFSSKYDLLKLVDRDASIGLPQEEYIQDALRTAIKLNKVEELQKLLGFVDFSTSPGVFANLISMTTTQEVPKPGVFTALMNHVPIVDMDPDILTSTMNAALVSASQFGSLDVIRILIEHGVDPSFGETPNLPCLYYSARNGRQEAVKLLLASGSKLISKHELSGNSLLHLVLHDIDEVEPWVDDRGSIFTCAKLLVEAGADINVRHPTKGTVLEVVLKQKRDKSHYAFANILLQHGADVDASAEDGGTLLHHAIKKRDLDLVHFLLKSGASVMKSDFRNHNALHMAAALQQSTGKSRRGGPSPLCPFMEEILRVMPDAHPLWCVTPLEAAIRANNGPACLALLKNLMGSKGINRLPKEMTPPTKWHTMRRISSRLKSPQNQSQQPGDQWEQDPRVQILKRTWHYAVDLESWASVCAFIEVGLQGSTRIFNLTSGSKLFQYAIGNEIEHTLVLFMGDRVHTSGKRQDPHLGGIWKRIRSLLEIFDMTGCFDNKLLSDEDGHVETLLIENRHRLKNLCFIGGYHSKLGWLDMVEKGYVETQEEWGLIEVIQVDLGRNNLTDMQRVVLRELGEEDFDAEVEEKIDRLGTFGFNYAGEHASDVWFTFDAQLQIWADHPAEIMSKVHCRTTWHPQHSSAAETPDSSFFRDTIVNRLLQLDTAIMAAHGSSGFVEYQLEPNFMEVICIVFGANDLPIDTVHGGIFEEGEDRGFHTLPPDDRTWLHHQQRGARPGLLGLERTFIDRLFQFEQCMNLELVARNFVEAQLEPGLVEVVAIQRPRKPSAEPVLSPYDEEWRQVWRSGAPFGAPPPLAGLEDTFLQHSFQHHRHWASELSRGAFVEAQLEPGLVEVTDVDFGNHAERAGISFVASVLALGKMSSVDVPMDYY